MTKKANPIRPYQMASLPDVALMGDIIDSRSLGDSGQVTADFKAAIHLANGLNQARILSPLTVTLGDEFQGLVRGHRAAFEIANTLRLRLLTSGISCRFALGAIQLTTPINPIMAWGMNGPGLAEVREVLNLKNDLSAYQFVLPKDARDQHLIDALAAGMTHFENGWTSGQLQAVTSTILWGQTADRIATQTGVTPRAVRKQLQGADIARYRRLQEAILRGIESYDLLA